MAIRVRMDPILDRNVEVSFRDDLGPQARSKALAEIARQELKAAQEKNRAALGRVPPHETFVDGSRSDSIDAVKPEGRIVFEFTILDDGFEWIRDQLKKHSPIGPTKRYGESHLFFADDRLIEPGQVPPPAKEYVFVNIQPYARKIELGKQGTIHKVYHTVAALAASRFGNIAQVKFSYRAPLFGPIHTWAQKTRRGGRTGRTRDEWLRRQPAIVIIPRG